MRDIDTAALHSAISALIRELRFLRVLIEESCCQGQLHLVTKHDLDQTRNIIMSAISDFAAKQQAFNDRLSTAVDGAVASVTAITEDIQTLNDKITELQNSVGGVTPEDQALIDQLQAQGETLATKTESVSAALAALDALTPPKPPVG